ncbi:MAG: OpgC domain-containing protein [Afipia sp.]|nr:OpgC domain-containing protein [Afipia sp.]
MFRGLALWLIFIDHVSPDVLTWFTIRSYGFCDAAEIFIFISGYTAAIVYGRAMVNFGFVVGAARILKRVWQIYAAHLLLFTIYVGEITFLSDWAKNNFYIQEMGLTYFFEKPATTIAEALVLRFCPLNMDVLPLYIILMFFLPLVLWAMKRRPDLTLASSVVLYFFTWKYDLYLTAYPKGFWAFNPFAWQLLFVSGVWCALGGAKRISHILASPITMGIAVAYLLAAFSLTLTWYFPQLGQLPDALERWVYPIDKTDLDILRYLHFLALAVVAVRFVPKGWSGLKSPWLRPMILCGQFSLQIYCLGVFLAFAGYFVLTEASGGLALHIFVGIIGILIMCAVATLFTWFKRSADKNAKSVSATTSHRAGAAPNF